MNLNINVNRVLNSKAPKIDPLTESFNLAKTSNIPKDIINFMSAYKKSDKEVILERLSSLCDINSDITFNYFNTVIEVAELPDSKLNEYKDHIMSVLESTDDDSYTNRLNESISNIDRIITNNNDLENIREEALINLAINRIVSSCLYESYLDQELEVMIYNINTSPEVISDYELLLRKIKVSNTTEYFSSYPQLLIKNTEMIRNLKIRVTGDVLDLLTSMPTVIANKLCETKLSDSAIKSYVKIIDKQIATMYMELKDNEPSKYQIYSTYVKNLVEAKKKISEKYRCVSESTTNNEEVNEDPYANENSTSTDTPLFVDGVMEDEIAEMEDTLADLIFDPGEELNEEKLENFTRICASLEATNRIQKAKIKAGYKAGDATRKVVSKVKSAQTDAKRASLPIKRAVEPIYNMINKTVNDIKKMDKKERTERIITGGFKLKLRNYIKKGINILLSFGAGKVVSVAISGALGPLAGILVTAIGLYSAIAIDKKVDTKVRQEILTDLKGELNIVNEKIEDAKGDSERSKKYELMRIQQKLKKDIEKIEYHLE